MALQETIKAAAEATQRGDFAEALGRYDEALLEADSSAYGSIHYNRSVCLARLGREEEAHAALEASVASDPSRYTAWHNLAVASLKAGNMSEALEHVDKAVDAAEAADDAVQGKASRGLKATVLKLSGDFATATSMYSTLIDEETAAGESPAASWLCGRAETSCRQGNWEAAVEDYESCIEAHGGLQSDADTQNFAVALANVAAGHQQSGNDEDAKHRFEQSLEYKRGPSVLNNLAVSYIRTGELDKAEPLLREALELDPAHSNALVALGTSLAQVGRYEEAEPLLRRALDAARESGDTETEQQLASQHGVTSYKLKYFELAKTSFERVLELDPDNEQAKNGVMLASSAIERGDQAAQPSAPAPAPAPAPAAAASASSASPSAPWAAPSKPTASHKPAPRPSVPAVVGVTEDGCEGIVAALEDLVSLPYPEGVDPKRREAYLSCAEFEEVFGETKESFYAHPKWKRTQLKKKHRLF